MSEPLLKIRTLSERLNLSAGNINSVLTLIHEGATVPFIARYRKEMTGNLDEVEIRKIQEGAEIYDECEKRRAFILDTIEKMEKLTPELKNQILKAQDLNTLEDIYAPYKSKRKTKAMMAIEAGLTPLAQIILTATEDLISLEKKYGEQFLNPEHKITTFKEALTGATEIIMERIAHDVELKISLRDFYWSSAYLVSTLKEKCEADPSDREKYRDYFDYKRPIKELTSPKLSHQVLAIRRAMSEKILNVNVTIDEELAIATINKKYLIKECSLKDIIVQCIKRAYQSSIHPSLDLEIKTELKKIADEAAISVFGANLKNLLLAPYLGAHTVLGVDPGVTSGCKLAIVDETGKFVGNTVIYPHPPKMQIKESATIIEAIIEKFSVKHIAIGNGTYGRETLAFLEENVAQLIAKKCKATLTSEAGASVYSASDIAREEFPDLDATVRGAISIARRFQDPLAELVKIDPKSIGVGQYQHDVNQARLKKSLEGVVEDCVNFVGVDLNTASAPLLSFISGIGPSVATNIVKYRENKGSFKKRDDLLLVSRFSQKIFEQSAGFLRIYNSITPFDATFIHPERYESIEAWSKRNGTTVTNLLADKALITKLENDKTFLEVVGAFTHADIVKALKAPSQDPRTEFTSTEFRKDATTIGSIKPGEWYPGVVTNITNFGAFVDIGIKENGLLHISQMADRFVENPLELFKVGQKVLAKVIEVDKERKRISLSLKKEEKAQFNKTPPQGKNEIASSSTKNNPFGKLKGLKL